MASYPRGPRTLKGALVSVDDTNPPPKVIAFQYNPATLRRSLQPQMVGGEENDRSEAVRFTGAPIQTITVDVELDAADQLDLGDATAQRYGLLPQLAALELLVYPTTSQINNNQTLLESGTMEVAPMTAPRTLFVWGTQRVLPVRLTGYQIAEELFDTHLNPIQATVTLNMRVLNYSDLTSSNREYHEFMAYQLSLEDIQGKALSHSGMQVTGVKTSQL